MEEEADECAYWLELLVESGLMKVTRLRPLMSECDEITAKHIPEYGLEDNMVFSTDYPHLDVKYPHAIDTFLELPFSDQSKRKYLWDNCARLYNFQ